MSARFVTDKEMYSCSAVPTRRRSRRSFTATILDWEGITVSVASGEVLARNSATGGVDVAW